MTLPGFPSRIVLWNWSVTPGIEDQRTFTFLDRYGDPYDPGVVTAKAKDGTVSATVTGTGNTRIVTWSAEQTAVIPPTHWRLNFDGEDQLGGRIGISQPEEDPNLSNDWTIQLPGDGEGDGLTITVGGTGGSARQAGSTFTIPLVGRWNDPLITGAGVPAPALSLACAMEDLSPVPNGPVHGHRSCVFPGGPPLVPPTVDDIPNDDAWIDIADVADATIYDPFNAPINYFPPEALNVPVWFQIQTTDADGFVTRCYAYLPDGLPDAVADVDLFIFADGVRHSMTVPAPPDDDTPGTAVPQTGTITATAAVTPAAMSYVDGLLAALLARIVALEEA